MIRQSRDRRYVVCCVVGNRRVAEWSLAYKISMSRTHCQVSGPLPRSGVQRLWGRLRALWPPLYTLPDVEGRNSWTFSTPKSKNDRHPLHLVNKVFHPLHLQSFLGHTPKMATSAVSAKKQQGELLTSFFNERCEN